MKRIYSILYFFLIKMTFKKIKSNFFKGEKRVFFLIEEEKEVSAGVYYILDEKKWDNKELLCLISGQGDKWKVHSSSYLRELPPTLKRLCTDKVNLVNTYWCYSESLKEKYQRHPLSEDAMEYFIRESQSLSKQKENLISQLNEIQQKRYMLLNLSKKYNISHAIRWSEEADINKQCKDLIEFEPFDDGKKLIDFLYDTYGKNVGRDYITRLNAVCQIIDPTIYI